MPRTIYLVIGLEAGTQPSIARTDDPDATIGGVLGGVAAAEDTREAPVTEAPVCSIHDIPMVLMQGRKGPFWSCHERNPDGSWCSYMPPKAA